MLAPVRGRTTIDPEFLTRSVHPQPLSLVSLRSVRTSPAGRIPCRTMVATDSALVFSEGDIQDPVALILD
jgi:hypothetical protein